MPQPYCTGPVKIYVSDALLGTGERGPRIRTQRHYAPVFNDLGGTRVPFDLVYESMEAFVTVRLTWWDYGQLRLLRRPMGAETGNDAEGHIGSLMATEGKTFSLKLDFPYGGRMEGMPKGIKFVAAVLETDEDQPGTEAEYVDLTFHCIRKYNNGSFQLFEYT